MNRDEAMKALQRYFNEHGPSCDDDGHAGDPDPSCRECALDTEASNAFVFLGEAAAELADEKRQREIEAALASGAIEHLRAVMTREGEDYDRAHAAADAWLKAVRV